METRKGLLEGVTVLDLSRVLAGPYCGMMLADMGATVIKVEIPGKGDDSRGNFPLINGESAYYMNLNRNKLGITLDLKSERGKEIFRKLVANTDILIENYRPGVMDKLGLGYEELQKINPGLIYGCISGFGHYGPYSKRAGYDIIGQAMSGLMSTTGWPGGEPTRTGTAIADVMAGLSCCVGILAAYINKLKTGEGEKVDVALVDSMVSSLEIINIIYLCTGQIPQRIGNRYEAIYPYDSFKAADGSLVIGAGNDKLFGLLCQLMHKPELLEDPRFRCNNDRVLNNAALKPYIEAWLADKTIDATVDELLAAGIPAAPINTIDRVAQDPHIAGAREMFVEIDHPKAGKLKMTGNQIKLSHHKITAFTPAPLLSQDTEFVLQDLLGMTEAEIAQLAADKVF
ncbi:CaiB/BaiF CoA-transferase family protein [uncultured Phascolarctobacterium sp.]|uniref:CaiB/BaiF CoA transferase family protein n=1 Tax=uncultured Phascolarctobacterium sp. TaxID=512296 RepID=UPI0025D3F317|nr:CoA transferase [uncultured Phascolarctobacterium sp.]